MVFLMCCKLLLTGRTIIIGTEVAICPTTPGESVQEGSIIVRDTPYM